MVEARAVVDHAARALRVGGTDCPDAELEAAGMRGLWEAAVRFDPDRGVPFAAFAIRRVRGSMIDGLRSEGPLPRRRGGGGCEGAANDGGERRPAMPWWVGDDEPAEPDRILERAQLLRLLDDALAQLPAAQAEVIRRHYFEGENLADIARRRGRSRSWGSRQLDLAVSSLRKQLRAAA